MANIFKNQQTNQTLSPREILESKYKSSRLNLLIVVALTAVNMVMLLTNSDRYFLFSAFIPYMTTFFGMMMCGKFPAEFYGEDYASAVFLDQSFFISMIVIAVFILVLYLLSWLLSKKHKVGWLVFALVLFSVDTLCLLFMGGNLSENIVDILFHAFVIYELSSGIRAHSKLKKLSVEENVVSEVSESAASSALENPENTENIE